MPPRRSAQRWQAVRVAFLRATVLPGGGRSPVAIPNKTRQSLAGEAETKRHAGLMLTEDEPRTPRLAWLSGPTRCGIEILPVLGHPPCIVRTSSRRFRASGQRMLVARVMPGLDPARRSG